MHSSFTYDVVRDCKELSKEKTFARLYDLICAHGDVDAASWIEDGQVKTLTFNQQRQLADNWAATLSEAFGMSGRVCISLDSSKEWFPLFWGLVRSGHDVLAVDPSLPDDKVRRLMDQCGCKMIVSASLRELGKDYLCKPISDFVNSPVVEKWEPVWGHDIALCTSGTTADSRMFVYDEETICYLALFSENVHNENSNLIDDYCFRTLAFLPFHHVLGFAAIFIWSHFLGDTTVYLHDRSPQTIVTTVKECRVTQIVTVPLLVNSIAKALKANVKKQAYIKQGIFWTMVGISLATQFFAPKAGLKLAGKMFKGVQDQLLGSEINSLVIGGSHTDSATLRLLNGIGYFTICGYGMTETAITGFETSYRLSNRLMGSVGKPLAYTEYKIKDGSSKGELLVRGDGIHDGRFVDGKLLPPETEDGWFATGDVAKINRRLGRCFIVGRTKEVIINESGENVYPDELEDLFSRVSGMTAFTILGISKGKGHYEDITLVAQIGNKMDDEEFLRKFGAEVRQINRTLPVFKRLTRCLVTSDNLPMANGIKVKRLALKKMVENAEVYFKEIELTHFRKDNTRVKAVNPVEDIRKKVAGIYSEILGIPANKIDPDANFIDDMGGDSLQVLSLATKAEQIFGVFIPSESYICCTTINGATEVINNLIYGKTSGSGKLSVRQPIKKFEDAPEFKHFKERIDSLMAGDGDNPYFVPHDSPLLDTSIINGKAVLDFGSYNYVGMSGRKEVSDAAKAAIDKYGTSASGSRLLAGEKPVHAELEREIAEWKHAESALVCVGGHSTNVTVVGNFCGKNDLIVYDALAHNSIEQGCKLSEAMSRPFPHNDAKALDQILAAQRQFFEKVLIVVEGAYSMDGDVADVPAFVALKKKYGCFLMVDEAHSACVLGPTGGGVDEYFGLAPEDVDIKMGTLSKGLGTCGGYLAGRKCVIDYLRYNLPGFVFSVGMSPALAAGSLEAIRLLRHNPDIMKRLHDNIDFFTSEAKKRHLDICLAGKSAVLPVLVGKDEDAFALSNEMTRRGVFVPPAVYPAVPRGKARLRFDVISEHKPEQISLALDTLLKAADDLCIKLPLREYE